MPAKRRSGFTLLELMVTLSVAAILATLAYPGMRDFIRRNRVVEQSNGMQSNLQYARGQAAATRSYVSICPLAAGGAACAAGGDYGLGWLIYTAPMPNTAYDPTAPTTNILQQTIAAPSNTLINADQTGVLTYNALGELLIGETPANVNFCIFAENTDGTAINTSAVSGIKLSAANSGRVASESLAAGAACP